MLRVARHERQSPYNRVITNILEDNTLKPARPAMSCIVLTATEMPGSVHRGQRTSRSGFYEKVEFPVFIFCCAHGM